MLLWEEKNGKELMNIGLIKPVRTVSFSPGCKLLAAAGDSKTIALYDVEHGEQIANLYGHAAWIFSVDWSDTGEYLLSGLVPPAPHNTFTRLTRHCSEHLMARSKCGLLIRGLVLPLIPRQTRPFGASNGYPRQAAARSLQRLALTAASPSTEKQLVVD